MSLNITADNVREVLATPDPMLEALSLVLKEISQEAVASVALVLGLLGAKPEELPGEYVVQAVLVESDRRFKPVTRENWIKIYDSYTQIKAIFEANPDLKGQLGVPVDEQAQDDADAGGLLDGKF